MILKINHLNKKSPACAELFCTTYGTRTRDSSVKGRRLNLLTNAACCFSDGKDSTDILFNQSFF